MWELLWFLKRRRRRDADFSDEIAAHLALEADRLTAEGLSPADATHEARRRFGNVGLAQEAFHRRRTIGWIEAFPQQLRRAARRLARAPVFSITAVLTLTLGIGATTAVFSLVDGVLLRPLPFAQPARLVDLSHTMVLQGVSQVDQSDATYLYYRSANRVFTAVGAYRNAAVNLSDGGTGDRARAERIQAARASASVFGMLGIAPLRGRVLHEEEDLGGTPVAILGERLWKVRYASDPGIIGRLLVIDGVAHEVVGVMPERFAFPSERTALWLPIGIDPARTKSAAFDFRGVARLRTGVTPEAAAADLQALLPHVPDAFPGRLTATAIRLTHMRPVVRSLSEVEVGGVGRALWVVFGAGAFLLLIACANVANLFLVRAEERLHDLAVRRVLGAGHGVIVAEFLAEGLLVATIGRALGLALALTGLRALRSLASGIAIPRLDGVTLNGAVLAVAAGVTVLTALVMSVVPALRSFGPQVVFFLIQTGRGVTAGRSRHRARRAFVVVQVALALVLVTGAGLMARSFRILRSVPPGFDAARSYAFRVALPDAAYPTERDAVGFVMRALEEVAARPGVQAAGVVSKLPLDDEARADTAVFVEDRPLAMGTMPNVHQVAYATPGAFAALGIPFLQGQAFEPPDPRRAPLKVVVTHALARRYWGQGRPVGRRLRLAPGGPALHGGRRHRRHPGHPAGSAPGRDGLPPARDGARSGGGRRRRGRRAVDAARAGVRGPELRRPARRRHTGGARHPCPDTHAPRLRRPRDDRRRGPLDGADVLHPGAARDRVARCAADRRSGTLRRGLLHGEPARARDGGSRRAGGGARGAATTGPEAGRGGGRLRHRPGARGGDGVDALLVRAALRRRTGRPRDAARRRCPDVGRGGGRELAAGAPGRRDRPGVGLARGRVRAEAAR